MKNDEFQTIDRSNLEIIFVRSTTEDIRESIHKKFQGSTKLKYAHLQALCRDFKVLCMPECESVTCYFARIIAIFNNMTSHRAMKPKVVHRRNNLSP